MNLILIGYKNCGKTSVGKLLAEKLNRLFIDTDQLIEQRYYQEKNQILTTCDIYRKEGENYFRDQEKRIIASLNNTQNSIIATGGGSILEKDNVAQLKKLGKLIYLNASFDVLQQRLQSTPAFLDIEKNIFYHYEQRKNLYPLAADKELIVEKKSITSITNEILLLLRIS